jgi:hypothetical protein
VKHREREVGPMRREPLGPRSSRPRRSPRARRRRQVRHD